MNAWGNGAPSQLRAWTPHALDPPAPAVIGMSNMPMSAAPGSLVLSQQQQQQQHGQQQTRSHCPGSAPATPGGPLTAPFQGGPASSVGGSVGGNSGLGSSSDHLSFFSFGRVGSSSLTSASESAGGGFGASVPRASTAPAAGGGGGGGLSGLGVTNGSGSIILPGLGFLEESAGAGSRLGFDQDFDDEVRVSFWQSRCTAAFRSRPSFPSRDVSDFFAY